MDKDDELLKVLDKLNNKLDKMVTNMEKGILEEEEKIKMCKYCEKEKKLEEDIQTMIK